jgi:hypothetical protein
LRVSEVVQSEKERGPDLEIVVGERPTCVSGSRKDFQIRDFSGMLMELPEVADALVVHLLERRRTRASGKG